MKKSYLGALLFFAFAICLIALLSSPRDITWIAMYLDNHKLKRAEILLSRHYQAHPADLDNAQKLVETLQALNENDRAKSIVIDVLGRHPDNRSWKRSLAMLHLAENNPEAAAQVLAPSERDRAFWLSLAQGYHDLKLADRAEEALFGGVESDADMAESWKVLGLWRAQRSDLAGEKMALENALALAPQDMELIERYFHNRASAGDLEVTLQLAAQLPKPLERPQLEALYKLLYAHKNYDEAEKVLAQLLEREDVAAGDYLALVSLFFIQNKLKEAQAILEGLNAGREALTPDEKGALFAQSQVVKRAMIREAAKKGEEGLVTDELAALQANPGEFTSEDIRTLVYACLSLSDFYEEGRTIQRGEPKNSKAPTRSWLNEANALFHGHRQKLPLSNMANGHLAADLAERNRNWHLMLEAWTAIAESDGQNIEVLLGIARAAHQLHDYEMCWQSLQSAELLAKNEDDLLAVALLAQTVASELPADSPQRAEKMRKAEQWASNYLNDNWHDRLALNLYFQALGKRDLPKAEKLLSQLESRDLVAADAYLGLAEAQVAAARHSMAQKGKLSTALPERLRESAGRNALKAFQANEPAILPRLLYIFMALNDKVRLGEILKQIEQGPLVETPSLLFQMAEAYGVLGETERKFALLEKRAMETGRLTHWGEAIDHCVWEEEYERALDIIEKAENFHPKNSELIGRKIGLLTALGKYGEAVKTYQQAQSQQSAIKEQLSAPSLAALGLAYDNMGFPEKARHFFQICLKKDEKNERALYGLADLMRREGKKKEAGRLFEKILTSNPKHVWAQAELASLRPKEKKQRYNSIIASTPENAHPGDRAALALALRQRGRLREALKLYSELIREPNRTPGMWCDYAQALEDADKIGEAKHILKKAIREFPDQIRPYMLLAGIHIREKEFAPAETCLQKALIIKPNDTEILRGLATVQNQLKKSWSVQKALLHAGKR